jgi:hypothetical protein
MNIKKESLSAIANNFIFAIWLGGIAVLQNRINTLSVFPEMRCSFKNYVSAFQYWGPCLTCLFISCSYYTRHSQLRKKIKTEAVDWIGQFFTSR